MGVGAWQVDVVIGGTRAHLYEMPCGRSQPSQFPPLCLPLPARYPTAAAAGWIA